LKILNVLLLVIITNFSFSQSGYTDIEIQARQKIFSLKFNEAENILKDNKTATSNYLLCYENFLQNLLIGGTDNYSKFEKQFNVSSKFIEKAEDDSLKLSYLSEINLQNAIIKLLNRDFISGAVSFIKSYGYFKDSEKKYPKSFYNLKLNALYNIIGGITPDKGKVFLSAIGLHGDISKGLSQMNSYVLKTEKKPLYYSEAFIMNMLIVAFMKEDVGNIQIPKLSHKIENNSLFIFSKIMIDYKEHKYFDINNNINLLSQQNITELPYVYYILGIINSINNKEKAIKNLKVFLIKNKSKHFIKASNWQLARIAVLQNNESDFVKYKQNTLELGSAFTEADKQALAEASLKHKPNIVLLKARLLFDAGEYAQAKSVLLKKENKTIIKTNEEYVEFFYRLARLYFEESDITKAKKYYKLVVDKQEVSERYFAPYSALQLGIIYEDEKNYIKAKKYYNIALEINTGEYKNSIKHKANSRLENLN